jgi:hypothetical protein
VSALKTLRAQVRRRLLISYRVDPVIAQALIPEPFRPQLVDGSAVAGICMIGLQSVRPGWLKSRVGFSTENVAHRVAVEWDEDGERHTGVYIVERHSSSLLPVLAGGRLFPGVQRRARFTLDETSNRFRVKMSAPGTKVDVDVELGGEWTSALFPSLEAASAFHELTSTEWAVEAGHVIDVRSSFFDALPKGSAVLDSVVVMRDLPFFWDTPHIVATRTKDRFTDQQPVAAEV